MKHVMTRAAAALGLWALIGATPACDGTGHFDGGVGVDAGPIGGGGVPLAAIGTACEYNHNDPNAENPSNQCLAQGEECLLVSSDIPPSYDSGLGLATWEDQYSIYKDDGIDVGYCTPKGSLLNPAGFSCPAGSAPKALSPNILICARLCNAPGDCGRSDFTCDVRYFDIVDTAGNELPTCVRNCTLDVPDCVRSGVIQNPNQDGFHPELLFDDLSGASQCGDSGICEAVTQHGFSNPGEPCTRTQDCKVGAVCMQAEVVNAVVGAGATTQGFCASPCTPAPAGSPPDAQSQQGTCTDEFVCQSAGAFNLGFVDVANGVTGPIVRDLASGAVSMVGGFCFHQCVAGVQGQCGGVLGTTCGSLDEGAIGDTWNGVSQCLPTAIAN